MEIYHTEKNYPMVLEGENAITYGIIISFMKAKKNVVVVYRKLALNEIRSTSIIKTSNENSVVNVKAEFLCPDYLYMGIQSKKLFFFQQGGVRRPMDLIGSISLYCKGLNWKGSYQKQDFALRISEGKKRMATEAYNYITRNIFCIRKKEHIFAYFST